MSPQSRAFSLRRSVFPAPYSHSFCGSAASRSGYESVCKDFVPDDLEVQVPGRAFLVTGGNSGIGKATATEIAKRGGIVHLVCREQDRAPGAQGVYILMTALVPVLEKEHDPRVITVSSGGTLVQELNTNDLQSEGTALNGTMVYAQSKRQQVLLTEQWARVPQAVHFLSVHPGSVDTPGVRLSVPGFHARFRDRPRSAAQGAGTLLWLALAPAASMQPSGRFFLDWKLVATHLTLAKTPSSPAEEEKLIEILEDLAQGFK